MRRIRISLLLVFLTAFVNVKAQQYTLDTSSILPKQVYTQQMLKNMGVKSLNDILKKEIGFEIENSPTFSGSRVRMSDLNGKYFKILLNGIPFISREDFASNVDLDMINLNNVDYIELQYIAETGELNNGSLTGVINIITRRVDLDNIALELNINESSVVDEYKFGLSNASKGKHLQRLYFSTPIIKDLAFDIGASYDQFNGYQEGFNTGKPTTIYDGKRGYKWSGNSKWSLSPSVNLNKEKWSLIYRLDIISRDLTVYGRSFDLIDDTQEPYFTTMDIDYKDKVARHYVFFKTSLANQFQINSDLSYQTSLNSRDLYTVRTDDNSRINSTGFIDLYNLKTLYFKTKITKALQNKNLVFNLGVEFDNTKARIAADQSTYQSKILDNTIFNMAEFFSLDWKINSRVSLQPSLRVAHNNYNVVDILPSFNANYALETNSVYLGISRVNRMPNHRELFTYLENDFNLLKGNKKLKSEIGTNVYVGWNKKIKLSSDLTLLGGFLSKYQVLDNRIVIESTTRQIPTQDSFIYNNANKHYTLFNQLGFELNYSSYNLEIKYGLIGNKGNDISDSTLAKNYLFHNEFKTVFRYNYKDKFWIYLSNLLVDKQRFYSFDKNIQTGLVSKVYNKAASYDLLDINVGKSFYKDKISLSLAVKNLFNVNTIKYKAVDNLEHFTGDLRTKYIDYGRSFVLDLVYKL